MRKLLLIALMPILSISHDCRSFDWRSDILLQKITWGCFIVGTGLYSFQVIWQPVYRLLKPKIDDIKADEIAHMLFIELKLNSECTPYELKIKKELSILHTRIIEKLRARKADLSKAAQGAINLLDTLLTYFDHLALQQNQIQAYPLSAKDGTSWYDRAVQNAFVDSFLLALKPSAQASADDISKKVDDMHLRALVFDKLLVKIDNEPETPLWVARKYLVKTLQTWLAQKDVGESTHVLRALEMINGAYKAHEQLKESFKNLWQQ